MVSQIVQPVLRKWLPLGLVVVALLSVPSPGQCSEEVIGDGGAVEKVLTRL
jgi:hypothetical protein